MAGMELTRACKVEGNLGEPNGESQAEQSWESGQLVTVCWDFVVLTVRTPQPQAKRVAGHGRLEGRASGFLGLSEGQQGGLLFLKAAESNC